MPLSRLFVPAVPALVVLAAHALSSRPVTAWAAIALALAGQAYAAVRVGPDAARVLSVRRRLSAELCPKIAGMDVVATVDAGWVGACSEGTVVDLSGVTDPEIAALRGGHTSKRVTLRYLEERRVEGVLVWIGDDPRAPRRIVEQRLLADMGDRYRLTFASSAELPTRYALYVRR
jgi:hypothetical protein